MLKILNKNKEVQQAILALDIGTSNVRAVACEVEGEKGIVWGFSRQPQVGQNMLGGSITDMSGIISTCKKAIREAERMAGFQCDKLIIGVAGELVKGSTVTLSYIREEPEVKIDLAELKNIVHKLQWKAFEQARSEMAYETGRSEVDIKLVSAAVMDVKVDDYGVANPIGFSGREVQLNLFNAFSPLVHYGALQTIAAELDIDLLAITAEPYALAQSLQRDKSEAFNGIFIDVGGDTTDIAVVDKGTVVGTKMFNIGGNLFTKRIAQELNISLEEAEKIKLTYSKNQLEPNSSKIIKGAIESDIDVWLSGVGLTLNEFHELSNLPTTIYLCGSGSKMPEIRNILEERDWYKNLHFIKRPIIDFVNPKEIHRLENKTEYFKDSDDITALALAIMGVDLASEEQVLSKILRKVIRLMKI